MHGSTGAMWQVGRKLSEGSEGQGLVLKGFDGDTSVMKKILALLLGFATAISVVGCNTVEGIGKDVKQGGEAIEKSANKNR
jgi:entericidin B